MSFLNETKHLTLKHIFSDFGPFAEREQAEPRLSQELAAFRETLLQHPRLGYDKFMYCYFDQMAWSFYKQAHEPAIFQANLNHLTGLDERFWAQVRAEKNTVNTELEKDIEACSQALTEIVNKYLLKVRQERFAEVLSLSVCLFSLAEREDIGLPLFIQADFSQRTTLALRLFHKLENPQQLKEYACINELTRCLEPLSAQEAVDLLAIHLITHYQFHSNALTYKYSDEMEYTRRHYDGLQGALEEIEKALAAINGARKDGNATKEDKVKKFDEICADYAALLNMTPVSGSTEGKLS